MKILIPSENNRVAPRFCAANNFMVFDILDNGEIKDKKIIDVSGKGNFEKAKFVKELKIDIVLCLGIENWIYYYLTGFGIRVLPGINGDIETVINALIFGRLSFCPFPEYGFKVIPGRRHRRGWMEHMGFHDGHFKNRYI